MTARVPAPDTAEALAEVLCRVRDVDELATSETSCDYCKDIARALLDSGVLDAVKAEALREAADEAWGRATEATEEDPSWRGVTGWLRERQHALEARPTGTAPDSGRGGS